MAIKRYVASQDNTITNAYRENLVTRGTGSNMGASDTLELFSLYGQTSGSNGYSSELSRILVKFPIDEVVSDRNANQIPESGSVQFYLRLFNVTHGETLPRNMTVNVAKISQEWEEGIGKDMSSYLDLLNGASGSSWLDARKGSEWTNVGGDYEFTNYKTFTFDNGTEDLEVNISDFVEEWIENGIQGSGFGYPNYGVGVHITSSQEAYFSSSLGSDSGSVIHNTNGSQTSYYTKKFSARNSEYFYKRPIIEARWNSSKQDDRNQVIFSSSLMNAEDNLNTLYLYNYVRGKLRNIPNLEGGKILVSLYSGSLAISSGSVVYLPTGSKLELPVGGDVLSNLDTNITGGIVDTGVYTASFAITSSVPLLDKVFDVWHSGGVEFVTSSFEPKTLSNYEGSINNSWYSKITNLKPHYSVNENARFRVYTRKKNWSPTIYNVARNKPELEIIPSASYEIFRETDKLKVIPFGTGSDGETIMSYDVSGNYFDLDMSLLEPDYGYGVRLAFYNDDRQSWEVQRKEYKFRVFE